MLSKILTGKFTIIVPEATINGNNRLMQDQDMVGGGLQQTKRILKVSPTSVLFFDETALRCHGGEQHFSW